MRIISFIILVVICFGCHKKLGFGDFDFGNKTVREDRKQWQVQAMEPTSSLKRTYILRVVNKEAFLGGEPILLQERDGDVDSVLQFSYMVLGDTGRVYFNTIFSDSISGKVPVKIDPVIEVCDSLGYLSSQGVYSILSAGPPVWVVEMELERKGLLNKHYYMQATIYKDSLHITKMWVPRSNTPFRPEYDQRKNYKLLNADSVFTFPLIFSRYKEDVELRYGNCKIKPNQ